MIEANYLYNIECKRMFDCWSKPEVDTPNLLIIQPKNGGVGCDYFVMSLAKAFHKKSGNKRSFKRSFLSLRYSKDFSEHEMKLFFDSPRLFIENYNCFNGTLCINVSDCVQAIDYPAFNKLLDFINTNKKDTKFIFIVDSDEKESAIPLYDSLKRHIRIARMTMEYFDVKTYLDFALEMLKKHNLPVESNADGELMGYLETLTGKADFAGYDSVIRLIEDLVFESRLENITVLTSDILENMKNDLIIADKSINHIRKIGF